VEGKGGSLAHGVMVIQLQETSRRQGGNRAMYGPTHVRMWRFI
jgi:hypothetical protein